jgi:hypothetical protein
VLVAFSSIRSVLAQFTAARISWVDYSSPGCCVHPGNQFYGERGGRLRDPFGQQWMMSQHIEDVPAGEMARRAAAFFSGR